jgi:hypothetical protein
MKVGPDVWNNAPDGSSPVDEISAWLGTMRAAAEDWRPAIRAKEEYWTGKIDVLVGEIGGLLTLINGEVFLGKDDRATYDRVCAEYQDLKDKLTLSPDFYLSQFQQDLGSNTGFLGQAGALVESLTAKAQALLRQLFGGAGTVIGIAIVIVLTYLYFTRRK